MSAPTSFNRSSTIIFVIQNITTNRCLRIFDTNIEPGRKYNLMRVPGITEEDIRASIITGPLKGLLSSGLIKIVSSSVNFDSSDSAQNAFLSSVGINPGGSSNSGVANIAALAAINASNYTDGIRIKVNTVNQEFELNKSDTSTVDNITVVAASGGGNWLRIPTFSRKWANQLLFAVDAINGNDENSGADSTGNRLQTVAEACRRLSLAKAGKNYQIKLTTDSLATDRFRPSFVQDQNTENVIPVNGFEDIFNITLTGNSPLVQPAIASGTVGAGGLIVTTGMGTGTVTQASLDLGSGALPAQAVGNYVVLTSGPNIGAIVGVSKDLGSGVAEVTEVRTPFNSTTYGGNTAVTVIAAGTTFNIITMVKWNGPLIQMGNSQGRIIIQNLLFPQAVAAPAEQNLLSWRYTSVTFFNCIFQRPVDFSAENHAMNSCIFNYTGQTGTGVGGTVVIGMVAAACAYSACIFMNADLRLIEGSFSGFISSLGRNSRVSTVTSSAFKQYGFFSVAAGNNGANIFITGSGLGLYNSAGSSG